MKHFQSTVLDFQRVKLWSSSRADYFWHLQQQKKEMCLRTEHTEYMSAYVKKGGRKMNKNEVP